MKQFIPHIIIPAIMPVNFFIIVNTPVDVLGCRTRGLFAVLIALISGFMAVRTAITALKGRIRGDRKSIWWIGTTAVLTIPIVALIIMA